MSDENAPLRIALPIHAFEPGGVERVGLRLAKSWADMGHDVVIVLGRDRGPLRDQRPPLDYQSFKEPFASDGWETIWMMISLTRFLLREKVDVVFAAGLTYTAPCVIARLILGKKCPPVLVKLSNDLERSDMPALARPFYHLWLRIQGRLLDHFVAIGEPQRAPSARLLGIDQARVTTIANPVLTQADIARLAGGDAAPHSTTRTGRHFVSVGRLVPQKNYTLLLDAFAQIAQPDDRLTIAGEGPCRADLESHAATLGIADCVSLPGHVSDVAALYQGASTMVLSSQYEGVPAVVLEALAAGTPVATTDCCDSMPWLLGEGRFGVLSTPGSVGELAQAMENAEQMTLSSADVQAHLVRFTLEHARSDYVDLMHQLRVATEGKPTKPLVAKEELLYGPKVKPMTEDVRSNPK